MQLESTTSSKSILSRSLMIRAHTYNHLLSLCMCKINNVISILIRNLISLDLSFSPCELNFYLEIFDEFLQRSITV